MVSSLSINGINAFIEQVGFADDGGFRAIPPQRMPGPLLGRLL